jgi:hypothetical protein
MNRRMFIASITLGLLSAPRTAGAQPVGKVWRIGWLSPPSAKAGASELDALREGLRELNYVEGRNITIEARWADGDSAMELTQKWATSLRVVLQPLGLHDRPTLETALDVMRRRRPDALMTKADPLLASHRALIVDFAAGQRLLSMYGDREYVKVGGLMFYGTSTAAMWRQAAIYVDRIMRGAKPADLPVEQPTKFELVINLKTAKALGLTIPASLLQRADQVIE